jgi:hypothetical protein
VATPEQIELRKKWVSALRSGEYRQGRGALVDDLDGPLSHCCLGVACDVMGIPLVRQAGGCLQYVDPDDGIGEWGWLTPSVMRRLGLRTSLGGISGDRTLAKLNDEGKSFSEIADIIESEPEGLFE